VCRQQCNGEHARSRTRVKTCAKSSPHERLRELGWPCPALYCSCSLEPLWPLGSPSGCVCGLIYVLRSSLWWLCCAVLGWGHPNPTPCAVRRAPRGPPPPPPPPRPPSAAMRPEGSRSAPLDWSTARSEPFTRGSAGLRSSGLSSVILTHTCGRVAGAAWPHPQGTQQVHAAIAASGLVAVWARSDSPARPGGRKTRAP
jgi:hypothetical protein